ncbi:hypothetical protein [Hymenobacter weizhouensis]|uniref:hypothetical protein n=1 Tax=Hymenobacter sp. YIM 151500-1 TaxID=2987689 RepID=UPI002226D651|nr:hypothetical protein [Hymenobacter sp. YIM 151500-1]UYZ63483.1 hypothetical protein OIS53_01250 [Hymenobacter sp. YIM 151500-1]
MKQLLLLTCVAALGLSSCSKKIQCPAYSATKQASRVSTPALASQGTTPERQ